MATAHEFFRIGLGLLRAKQNESAAELAAEAVLEYPDDGDLWELLGVSWYHSARYRESITALETASLCQPLNAGARYCLAGAYATTHSRDLAVFVYGMIAEDRSAPLWLLSKVASRLGQLQAYEEALSVCRVLADRDPARHEAYFGQGFYLRRLGASAEIVAAAIEQAHQLAPASTLYRVVLASLRQELGQTEEAWELLRNLRPEGIGCCHSLRRMMDVFRAASDHERWEACRRRMQRLRTNRQLRKD